MAEANRKNDGRDPKKKTNKWVFGAYIGLFAGVIWGGLKMIESFFRFTKVLPGFLVEPYFKHSFLATWQGYLVGWAFFIVFSLIASLIYTAVLFKAKGPWPGLLYGVAWWVLLYLLIGPGTGMMPRIGVIDWNSLVTDVCLFLLWGLFIGYSIALEFSDERVREPFQQGAV